MYIIRFDSEGTRDTAIADSLATALQVIRRYKLVNPTLAYQDSATESPVRVYF